MRVGNRQHQTRMTSLARTAGNACDSIYLCPMPGGLTSRRGGLFANLPEPRRCSGCGVILVNVDDRVALLEDGLEVSPPGFGVSHPMHKI
jgi:hypothetical protein